MADTGCRADLDHILTGIKQKLNIVHETEEKGAKFSSQIITLLGHNQASLLLFEHIQQTLARFSHGSRKVQRGNLMQFALVL